MDSTLDVLRMGYPVVLHAYKLQEEFRSLNQTPGLVTGILSLDPDKQRHVRTAKAVDLFH